MSELARRLIDAAQADCASRLAAIEAHAALIEEAETLAATLRSHGIADATAHGLTCAGFWNRPGRLETWVTVSGCDVLALQWALRDACLRVVGVRIGDAAGELQVDGIDCGLAVPTDVARHFAAILPALMKENFAHA